MIKFGIVVGSGKETTCFGTKLPTLIKDRQVLMALGNDLGQLLKRWGSPEKMEWPCF